MLTRPFIKALSLLYSISSAYSTFTFQFGNPTQCGSLNVSWTGGQAPFELVLIPVFGIPRNVTIPSSAFTGGKGSFQLQIPFLQNHQMMIVMSDATGFASGGVSALAKVGAPVGGNSCNTTDPAVPFSFELNTALTQCRTYTFNGYDLAVQPVTISGYIPGGDSFILRPPSGQSSFDWTADLAAGTSVVFAMTDANGNSGGSSDLKLSGASDDSTCLNSQSPVSTSNAPSPASSTSSQTSSPTSPPSTGSEISSTAIALASIGGVVALAIIVALVVFLVRRRSQSRGSAYYDGGFSSRSKRGSARIRSVDLTEQHDPHFDPPRITPFSYQPSNATSSDHLEDRRVELYAAREPYPLTGIQSQPQESSTGRTKASLAGVKDYNRPHRFIVHTDVEDAVPDDQNDELIELPPTYSEGRAPLSQFSGASSHAEFSSPSSSSQPLPPLSFDNRSEHSYSRP